MAIAQQSTAYVRNENADPQLLALKVPPHSIEAEQSLLGALLLDNQAFDRVADLVTGEDFYRDDHRRIWRHITRLIEAAKPADVVTVSESVEASEDKDKTGGPAYLGALAQNTPSALNVRRYAELVHALDAGFPVGDEPGFCKVGGVHGESDDGFGHPFGRPVPLRVPGLPTPPSSA
jgi:hypothetical protein